MNRKLQKLRDKRSEKLRKVLSEIINSLCYINDLPTTYKREMLKANAEYCDSIAAVASVEKGQS